MALAEDEGFVVLRAKTIIQGHEAAVLIPVPRDDLDDVHDELDKIIPSVVFAFGHMAEVGPPKDLSDE